MRLKDVRTSTLYYAMLLIVAWGGVVRKVPRYVYARTTRFLYKLISFHIAACITRTLLPEAASSLHDVLYVVLSSS